MHHVSCQCGCLRVHGRDVTSSELPEQLKSVVGQQCQAFAIRSQSISVKNEQDIDIMPISSQQIIVSCINCGEHVNILDKMGYGFCVFCQKHYKPSRRQSYAANPQTTNASTVALVKKYITIGPEKIEDDPPFSYDVYSCDSPVNDDDDSDFDDDGDFEYMFSGTSDPFVGSFTDRFMDSPIRDLLVSLI